MKLGKGIRIVVDRIDIIDRVAERVSPDAVGQAALPVWPSRQPSLRWEYRVLVLVGLSIGVVGCSSSSPGKSTEVLATQVSADIESSASQEGTSGPNNYANVGTPAASVGTERWGDFVLTDDLAATTPAHEADGARKDFPWAEGEGPFDHHLARADRDGLTARNDPRIPWPAFVPIGEDFLLANVVADSTSAADAAVVFIRTGDPDVLRYASAGLSSGDDGTLMIAWSSRFSRPAYVQTHGTPMPINGSASTATVFEDTLLKVTVGGYNGIMRLWSTHSPDQQNMYGSRLPTVIINWFDGDGVLWTVQSFFLSPQEALQVAESIRPTRTS